MKKLVTYFFKKIQYYEVCNSCKQIHFKTKPNSQNSHSNEHLDIILLLDKNQMFKKEE